MDTLKVSTVLLQHPDMETFADLHQLIQAEAKSHMFLEFDVRPPYADTPDDWQERLEAAFTGSTLQG